MGHSELLQSRLVNHSGPLCLVTAIFFITMGSMVMCQVFYTLFDLASLTKSEVKQMILNTEWL